jgi:hypothetical protein
MKRRGQSLSHIKRDFRQFWAAVIHDFAIVSFYATRKQEKYIRYNIIYGILD